VTVLDQAAAERIKRLEGFMENLEKADTGSPLPAKRSAVLEILNSYQGRENICPDDGQDLRARFLEGLPRDLEGETSDSWGPYLAAIQSLPPSVKSCGSRWLQAVVDRVVQAVLDAVPEYGKKKGN
ncbi:MAG TPA: hypothetical protein VKO20_09095, partial [Desulfosalsimonadaceae bacterium]|nr:hypothetical protein [Desulfosalsimonadaceae bacterium]